MIISRICSRNSGGVVARKSVIRANLLPMAPSLNLCHLAISSSKLGDLIDTFEGLLELVHIGDKARVFQICGHHLYSDTTVEDSVEPPIRSTSTRNSSASF